MATIVVLGMHRSGTSCVTRALHEGGMYLGENLMNHVASDNLEGHWESRDAVQINDDILSASGAEWHQVPEDLTLNAPPFIDRRMAAFLKQLAAGPIHGFKDPRTLITFPFWQPHLRRARYVACLRHPYNVANSLSRRVIEWKWEQGLQMWTEYNLRLLHYTSEIDPASVYWFNFDAEPEAARATLRHIVAGLGLTARDDQFNAFLRHHDEQPEIKEPHLAELYHALRERVEAQQAQLETAKCTVPAEACVTSETLGTEEQLHLLRGVNVRHDELLQRQQAAIWSLESKVRDSQSRYDDMQGRWTTLSQQCQQHQQQTDLGRQELIVRSEELLQRGNALEAAVQQQAQERGAERQALDGRLLEISQALGYLHELVLQQHAINVAACHQLQERIELLTQRTELLTRQNELLSQQNDLLSQRTNLLQQRLFWPMVARKSRALLARLKAGLWLPRARLST